MNPLFDTRTILLNERTSEQKREEILDYFYRTFDLDGELYTAFSNTDALYMRADPLRHPLIFYYGHTAVFFINKLILAGLLNKRVDPRFESIFAVGVDEMSWDDLNMSNYAWPSLDEVREYRQKVRDVVAELIGNLPFSIPVTWDSDMWILLMGIEHQRIHIETSSVLIRQLPLQHIKPIDGWSVCTLDGEVPINTLLPVDAAKITLGKPRDHKLYGWDNEYGQKVVDVNAYKASKFLCSNGEFKAFVDEEGYKNSKYWTNEGWGWRSYEQASSPRFWIERDGIWFLRLVFNEIELPLSWPVEVNYLEAKAFCNWKSEQTGTTIRLPLEEEWHLMLESEAIPDQPYWEIAPGNINMAHFQSPCPVDHFKFGRFYDVIGNVWQWTETPIDGYEGFKVHPFYDDFSTPTFDSRHNIIKGGSWISTGNEATQHARYAFRRHFYQHAGFRYVESEIDLTIDESFIEQDKDVTPHCKAHYVDTDTIVPNYRKAIANYIFELMAKTTKSAALDIGCRVGRTTWELAKGFDKVVGVDFTARYIRVPVELRNTGRLRFISEAEGELVTHHEVTIDSLAFTSLKDKVEFWQADPSNLKPIFKGYDLILLNDVITSLYDPINLLETLNERLNKNGLLVITTDYCWNSDITPREKQIGGLRENGEQLWGFNHLADILGPNFICVETLKDIYDYLPTTNRVGHLKKLEITVWKKR